MGKGVLLGVRLDSGFTQTGYHGEAARFLYLMDLYRAGVIDDLIPRPDHPQRISYCYADGVTLKDGVLGANRRVLSSRSYTPDFMYRYQGCLIVEDVKPYKRSLDGKRGIELGCWVKPGDRLRIELGLRVILKQHEATPVRFRYIPDRVYTTIHPAELI